MLLCLRSDPRTSSNTTEGTDDDEEILGSDDDEQEDPSDYCKGEPLVMFTVCQYVSMNCQ
jgi:hypothetical protein